MFTSIRQFEEEWLSEAQSTQRLFDALTDESLSREVAPNLRTLGRLAWHLVTNCHGMMGRIGLKFDAPGPDHPLPASAREIAESFAQASDAMLTAIRTQWNDRSLEEVHNLYGEDWSNALTLRLFISHLIHHRGQMTVLMRQAGIVIPDLYGPTFEQWAAFGQEPPAL